MLNHFNFKRIDKNCTLITNDFGCYDFLDNDEFKKLVTEDFENNSNLNRRLHEKYFIVDDGDLHSNEVVASLRRMKGYLFQSTSLHIFVMTNKCNLNCIYCQAQDHNAYQKGFMTKAVAFKAIDIALESPSQHLSFEFQGGEPLLNFNVIKAMIEYAEANKKNKIIDYTIVSNFSLMSDEIADFIIEKKIQICTSLDGPEQLHIKNRLSLSKENSYRLMLRGMEKLIKRGIHPGAIQTTTRYSLNSPREIVREYVSQGLHSLFLRPLTPLGFAKTDWDKIGYSVDEFLKFYESALEEIFDVNREGYFFQEQHAIFFLKKIMLGISDNYMELRSPCGAAIGQLAYYYNGDIYTCDEARMIAEAGNPAFTLGNVFKSSYRDLINNDTCKAVCSASILETIPKCCSCVYQPYCGVCPVINYASYGKLFNYDADEYRCKTYAGILDILFKILKSNNEEKIAILKSWICR